MYVKTELEFTGGAGEEGDMREATDGGKQIWGQVR